MAPTSTDTKFFTNDGRNSLLERFKQTLKHVDKFDVLVGYFRASGFYALYKDFLEFLPIPFFEKNEKNKIIKYVSEIIKEQKINPRYNYNNIVKKIDEILIKKYNLEKKEISEINCWLKRHYSRLF